MRIILSHNMSGLTDEEVERIRHDAILYLKNKYPEERFELIDNYNHLHSPELCGLSPERYLLNDNCLVNISKHMSVDGNLVIGNSLQAPSFMNPTSLKLWHLGRSIQQIGQAEAIYFVPGHSDSRGCEVEKYIAELYELKILE